MNPIMHITPDEATDLYEQHQKFDCKAKLTGCSVAAAAFLIVGSLIVISCACLCLTLPGVNVINQVILPGVVPGSLGILASVPFIILSIRYSKEKNAARKELVENIITLLDNYDVPEMERKKRPKFILNNFLKEHWTKDYRTTLLSDIKERLGSEKEDRNPRQEKIAKALDKATAKVRAKKKT